MHLDRLLDYSLLATILTDHLLQMLSCQGRIAIAFLLGATSPSGPDILRLRSRIVSRSWILHKTHADHVATDRCLLHRYLQNAIGFGSQAVPGGRLLPGLVQHQASSDNPLRRSKYMLNPSQLLSRSMVYTPLAIQTILWNAGPSLLQHHGRICVS